MPDVFVTTWWRTHGIIQAPLLRIVNGTMYYEVYVRGKARKVRKYDCLDNHEAAVADAYAKRARLLLKLQGRIAELQALNFGGAPLDIPPKPARKDAGALRKRSIATLRIMAELKRRGIAATIAEISRVSRTNVRQTLLFLESKGYVYRDSRKLYHLTEVGELVAPQEKP